MSGPSRRNGPETPPIKLAIRDHLSAAIVNVGLAREMAADGVLRERLQRALDALDQATNLLMAYEAGRTNPP